jgi:hypothetical protein
MKKNLILAFALFGLLANWHIGFPTQPQQKVAVWHIGFPTPQGQLRA